MADFQLADEPVTEESACQLYAQSLGRFFKRMQSKQISATNT